MAESDPKLRTDDDRSEVFISVDVETAGPIPRDYALLSIGACLVSDPESSFYVELAPTTFATVPGALEVSGLSLESLAVSGLAPRLALERFAAWVEAVVPEGSKPVFAAFNAPFDWAFVNDAFHRELGSNPFGHSAFDIKAYFAGLTGSTWSQTSMRYLAPRYLHGRSLSHNALDDARDQAELFRAMLDEAGRRTESH